MQQLTVAGRSWFVGDALADLLLRYAELAGTTPAAVRIGFDALPVEPGPPVRVDLVVGTGAVLVAESVGGDRAAPDNPSAEARLHRAVEELDRRQNPPWEDLEDVWGGG